MPDKNQDTQVEIKNEGQGKVTFNSSVIATIAGLATVDVEGIAGMSGGFASGVAELLGRTNLTKGVSVDVGEEECTIDLHIIVKYGTQIHKVCENVQKSVKQAIETMTGLNPVEINVYVQGVEIKEAEEPIPVEEGTK